MELRSADDILGINDAFKYLTMWGLVRDVIIDFVRKAIEEDSEELDDDSKKRLMYLEELDSIACQILCKDFRFKGVRVKNPNAMLKHRAWIGKIDHPELGKVWEIDCREGSVLISLDEFERLRQKLLDDYFGEIIKVIPSELKEGMDRKAILNELLFDLENHAKEYNYGSFLFYLEDC